jgi:uncharacterized protein involved in propanediol utilization
MSKIKVFCTDKDQYVDADILNHKPKQFLEVALNTVRIRMNYKNNAYVGSMAGLEFVINEDQLPKDYKEYQR